MTEYFEGKKTYIVAMVMIAYAVMVMGLGGQSHTEAVELILNALAIAGLRAGVSKADKYV